MPRFIQSAIKSVSTPIFDEIQVNDALDFHAHEHPVRTVEIQSICGYSELNDWMKESFSGQHGSRPYLPGSQGRKTARSIKPLISPGAAWHIPGERHNW
jgi:hypothetical protein